MKSKLSLILFILILIALIIALCAIFDCCDSPPPPPPPNCTDLNVDPIDDQAILEVKFPIPDTPTFLENLQTIISDLEYLTGQPVDNPPQLIKACACDFILIDMAPTGIDINESDAISRSDVDDEGTLVSNIGQNFPIDLALPDPMPPVELDSFPPPDQPDIPNIPQKVFVAIIDTGIDLDHPDFDQKIWTNMGDGKNLDDDDLNCLIDDYQGFNFVNPTFLAPHIAPQDQHDPIDNHGHGTHVSGIVSMQYPPDIALQLLSQKALEIGHSTLFDAVCAMYDATNKGAQIMNLSWGYYGEESNMLREAVKKAVEEEILLITSAGNDNLNVDICPHWPSDYSANDAFENNVISVAALDTFDCDTPTRLAGYSNYGKKVDIAAPGTNILSSFPYFTTLSEGHKQISGTSMAAAFVTREASIIKALNLAFLPGDIKSMIIASTLNIEDESKAIKPQPADNQGKWLPPRAILDYNCE